MILFVAVRIFRDATEKMLDTSCDEKFEAGLRDLIQKVSESERQEIGIDLIRTRKFGEKIYAEIEINADGDMRLREAHDLAERIHDRIEREFPDIKHVMIHVNPAGYHYDVPEKL